MSSQPGARARWHPAIALIGALVLALPLAPAVSAASPTACRVRNLDAQVTRGRLQAAVGIADSGDRLTVRGTCHGIAIIDRSLTITGTRTATSGDPILDGDGLGSVLRVASGITVRIRGLTIRDGSSATGGGIDNQGTLVLRDVIVRRNTATGGGGGVHNEPGAVLKLYGSSSIRGNTATAGDAGGVLNQGTLRLYDSSSIRGNTSRNEAWGGGGVYSVGILAMNDSSSIAGNVAVYGGGGVFIYDTGTLVMNDSSSIGGNVARYGGGVLLRGILRMNGSSTISGNTATEIGGGIYSYLGTLDGVTCGPAWDANVHDNTPSDCYFY